METTDLMTDTNLKAFEQRWLESNWEEIGEGSSNRETEDKKQSGEPFVDEVALKKYYAIYVVAVTEEKAGRFRLCSTKDGADFTPLHYVDAHAEKPEGFLTSDVLKYGNAALPGGISDRTEFKVYGLSWLKASTKMAK